jgi:hypothetical protein
MHCVDLRKVRAEFVRRHTTGEEKSKDASRQAWRRALKSAKDGGYASETDASGTEWIWNTKA